MQVDALGANVAVARPVRMPDVRAAASSVLGTNFTGYAESRVSFCVGTEARGHHCTRVGLEREDFLAAVDQKSAHSHRR